MCTSELPLHWWRHLFRSQRDNIVYFYQSRCPFSRSTPNIETQVFEDLTSAKYDMKTELLQNEIDQDFVMIWWGRKKEFTKQTFESNGFFAWNVGIWGNENLLWRTEFTVTHRGVAWHEKETRTTVEERRRKRLELATKKTCFVLTLADCVIQLLIKATVREIAHHEYYW